MTGDIEIYPEDFERSPAEFYLFLMKLHQTYDLEDISDLYNYCKDEKPDHALMIKDFANDFNITV